MNFQNRTLFENDNLPILRGLDANTVDLIYLDPPFNSNQDYAAPIGSEAAGAAFKDTWTLSDVNEAEHGELADREPALYAVIHAAGLTHGKSMKSYLIMMGLRMLEMCRVLKNTGSIYLHCDPAASHYLKLVMDSVFSKDAFRSEIIWRRSNAHSKTSRQFGPIHDTILFYSKSQKSTFHPGTRPYTKAYIESRFTKRDERGRYQTNYLTGPGQRNGESGEEWRGFDPTPANRHWAIPRSLRSYLPDEGRSMTSREKLECLFSQGLIVFPRRPGGQPMYKQYVGNGTPYQDIWAYQPNTKGVLFGSDEHIDEDVKWLEGEVEKIGYPTQKPVGLLRRIIETSSNPDDIVLDPFCGCATTCIAAEKLGRQWVGIDISPRAVELVRHRLERELGLDEREGILGQVIHRTDIPRPSERLPNYRTHKHTLYGQQEGLCNGCRTHFPFRNMTVDHIVAQSQGGSDHLENLQLLCNFCNSVKGTNSQAYLITRLQEMEI